MSIFDSLLGNSQANAAKSAALDTFNKKNAAISGITDFGNQVAGQYGDLAKGYDPFVATGYGANSSLQNLIADPSSIRSLPGYQAALDRGGKTIDASAAAGGTLNSGRTGKALQSFGQNLEDQTYNSRVAQLAGLSQQGQGALTQQNSTIGTGLQDQLQTRQSAFTGGIDNAGTIGQGNLAAENAKTSALQSLLGTAAYLGGSALGGGGLSSFLKPSMATNNPFGGVSNPTFGR